jgi:hypothetical protein
VYEHDIEKTIIVLSVLLLVTIVSGYLFFFIPIKEKKRCTKTAIATITSVEEKTSHTKNDSGDRRLFRCKYSFSVGDKKYSGYEYSKQYNNSWIHSVGEHVYILYNENNPTEFMLSPVISHYCTWCFVPIASGILTILTFFGLVTGHIKESRSKKPLYIVKWKLK